MAYFLSLAAADLIGITQVFVYLSVCVLASHLLDKF